MNTYYVHNPIPCVLCPTSVSRASLCIMRPCPMFFSVCATCIPEMPDHYSDHPAGALQAQKPNLATPMLSCLYLRLRTESGSGLRVLPRSHRHECPITQSTNTRNNVTSSLLLSVSSYCSLHLPTDSTNVNNILSTNTYNAGAQLNIHVLPWCI